MVIISNPTAVPNEIATIHSLFEEGMELFHVRKPNFSEEEMKVFVEGIGLDYRSKLVLHNHHHLATLLKINRIHFATNLREAVSNKDFEIVKDQGFRLSTSTHSITEFNALDSKFDYSFLSPVFESISKENYVPKTNLFEDIKNRTNFNTKLIALGGIEFSNIQKTLESGFDDVALLGTIWNRTQPIKNFILCQQIVLSY
ncbi:thiamine phosphate synthase [Flavobacterium ovatum]|uniref:thiamine phosphate synthase n=1 Tax=Flavobacterium ovatum TaxID=1928857 RepID=UPI00344E36E5